MPKIYSKIYADFSKGELIHYEKFALAVKWRKSQTVMAQQKVKRVRVTSLDVKYPPTRNQVVI